MNNERQPNNSPEQSVDAQKHLEQIASEQAERIASSLEHAERRNPEQNQADAAREALETAHSAEDEKRLDETSPAEKAPTQHLGRTARKQAGELSFKRTMAHVQSEMSAPSRAFSKVIHNKAVERTSDALGSTVARPNAILAGAMFAFFITLGLYVMARNLGYPLSGFETIGAFILGWVLGLVFDFLRVMITGKRG